MNTLARVSIKFLFLAQIILVLFILCIILRIGGYLVLAILVVFTIFLTKEWWHTNNQNIPESWGIHVRKSLKSLWTILLLIIILAVFLFPFYIQPIMKIKTEENKIILQEIVKNITANGTTDIEKAKAIYNWFDPNSGNMKNVWNKKVLFQVYPLMIYLEPPYFCIRIFKHDYPLWVLTSRCGECEEYALLYMEMANEAGLKVRSVHNHGEEHNWDEVLINGRWVIVDPSQHLFDHNPSVYETHRHLNVSYVFALYLNGSVEDVTSRYTRMSTIKIKVMTGGAEVVPNATVIVYSKNYNPTGQFTGLTCKTDENGECTFQIGGGKYKIKVIDNSIIPRLAEIEFEVKEGSTIPIPLTARRTIFSLFYVKLPPTVNRLCGIFGIVGLLLMLWYSTVTYVTLSKIEKEQLKR